MRADAKIGVVLGAVVVIVASWYFFQRQAEAPVRIVSEPPVLDLARQANSPPPPADESEVARVEPPIAAPSDTSRLETPEVPGAVAAEEPGELPVTQKEENGTEPDAMTPDATARTGVLDLRESTALRANRRVTLELPAGKTPHAGEPAALTGPLALANAAGKIEAPPAKRPRPADKPRTSPQGPSGTLDLRTLIGATPRTPEKPAKTTTHSTSAVRKRTPPENRSQPAYTEYVIKRGDSLAILSEVHYGSQQYVEAILAANPHIKNRNKIFVGAKIRIPPKSAVIGRGDARAARPSDGRDAGAAKPKLPPEASGMYRVKSGDTLYQLAETHYGSGTRWRALLALNRDIIDGDGRNLRAGQLIRLPAVLPDAD